MRNTTKNILKFILLAYIFVFVNNKYIKVINSTVFFSRIKNVGINKFISTGSHISKSKICFNGSNNHIEFNNINLRRSQILVSGNNNQLIINKSTSLLKLKLVIRGNNCRVVIDECTTFGSGYLICMGNANYVEIGKDCQIADDVSLWATDSHPIYGLEGEILNPSKPIMIGDHVWIGNKSIVLKGVEIGENSVVGMGSVVTANIDSHSIYVGNPAKKIKTIQNWDRSFIDI